MKLLLIVFLYLINLCNHGPVAKTEYLKEIKEAMGIAWPKNRTINIVFHGHSVPAGYFVTPDVKTFSSYPMLVHMQLNAKYPLAVINTMNTAIGGENSEKGEQRFEKDVLRKDPDIIFIDYALNDRGMGLEKAKMHWEKMITAAISKKVKVFLLTPTPDKRENLLDPSGLLQRHADQIRGLAEQYEVGLIDSYALFKKEIESGVNLDDLMSQVNHPNKAGHMLVAKEILTWF